MGKVRLFWPGGGLRGWRAAGQEACACPWRVPAGGSTDPLPLKGGEVPVSPMAGGSLPSPRCPTCSGTGGPLVPPGDPEVSQPQGLEVLKYPWVVPACPKGLCLLWAPAGGTFCPGSRERLCPAASLSSWGCRVLPCPRGFPHPRGASACPGGWRLFLSLPGVLFWGSCCSHGIPTCPGGYLHVCQGLRGLRNPTWPRGSPGATLWGCSSTLGIPSDSRGLRGPCLSLGTPILPRDVCPTSALGVGCPQVSLSLLSPNAQEWLSLPTPRGSLLGQEGGTDSDPLPLEGVGKGHHC